MRELKRKFGTVVKNQFNVTTWKLSKTSKWKKLTIKNSKSRKYILYIAMKAAGRWYIISLLVRYNANLDFRSFCYAVAGLPIWLFWSQILKFWLFLTPLACFQSERLGSGKTMSELHIHYKSLLKRVYNSYVQPAAQSKVLCGPV